MRKRRDKKTMALFVIIFVAAFMIAFVTAWNLPMPGDWKRMVFFLLFIAIAFIGVCIVFSSGRRR